MSPRTYAAMSPAQKKVIDDHCTTEWAGKFADPWADFEHAGLAKVKAEPGHEVYTITDAQLGEWKKVGRAAGEAVGRQCPQGRRRSGCHHEGAQAVARAEQGGVLTAADEFTGRSPFAMIPAAAGCPPPSPPWGAASGEGRERA
jgi:hypothetical protein